MFTQKDEWLPQSPDLNLMDYSVWDSLTKIVYARRMEKFTEHEQKDKIIEKCYQISVAEIRRSISSWKNSLRMVDSEDGGHIDHLLD